VRCDRPEEKPQVLWDTEIAHRIRDLDAGDADTVPWDAVMAELRAKLGRNKAVRTR
jgi:hypothetical protein